MSSSDPSTPSQPQNYYVWCLGCDLLLSHPPTSVTIQCPKCNVLMDLNNSNRTSRSSKSQMAQHNGELPPTSQHVQRPQSQPSIHPPQEQARQVSLEHSTPSKSQNSSIFSQFVQAPENPQEFYTSLQDDVVNNLSRKSRSRKREPSVPKRASNAYMLFCKEQRPILRRNQPDLPFATIGATLGNMWRQLSYEDRRPYEARASKDRERYKTQMVQYTTNAMRNNFPKYSVPTLSTSSNPTISVSTTLSNPINYSTCVSVNSLGTPTLAPSNHSLPLSSTTMMNNLSQIPPRPLDPYHLPESSQRFDQNLYSNSVMSTPQSQQLRQYPPSHLLYNSPYSVPQPNPSHDPHYPMGMMKPNDSAVDLHDYHYIPKEEAVDCAQYTNDYFSFSPPSKYRLSNYS